MTIKKCSISLLIIFLFVIVNVGLLKAEESESPGKLAYKVMKTAESHKSKGEIYEAGKVFLESAMMYKRAIKSEPDNRGYKTNFKYCLGTRGYIHIKKGQSMIKEKKFGEAAKYFKWAADAYKYALKELPGERNFKTNLEFAQYHGGTANFEYQLGNQGKAPDLKIENFNGGKIDLADLQGKAVLLEFWAGWCPSCKKSLPKLEKLYKELSSKGFEIIAVAMDKNKTWKKYGSDKKAIESSKQYSFLFGWGDKSVSNAYGNFNSVPTIILIDKRGNLYKKVSSNDQSEENLRKLIKSLL
ncbi:MAG: TlpA family protein disulfide reductase [Candidatus Aminicenantes bacterium]|nr:TlpA family protein disulfide reductase [Candidatus Aminicenantes bacterium]